MMKFMPIVQLMFLLVSTSVLAQQAEPSVMAKFLIEAGVEYGGDEIARVFFTNGEDQVMRAGQGGYLAVGGQLEFAQVKPLMLRTSIGIKFNTTAADNANIRLTRLPFVAMSFWKINDDFRFGAGITSHLGVKFYGDDFLPDADFKSTLGPRFELGYKWIALTYSALNYNTEAGASFSAHSIGAAVSFTIPDKK